MFSSDFVTVALAHKQLFESHRGPGSVDEVVEELRELRRTAVASGSSPEVRKTLIAASEKRSGFYEAWRPLTGRFAMLRYFCGGITIVLRQFFKAEPI